MTHGNPSGAGDNTLVGVDARLATSTFRGGENLSLDLYAFVTDDEASGRKGHAWGGKVDYPNDLWDVALSFKEIDADFRPALGFVSRTGIRKTTAKADFMPRPGRAGIRQLFLEASAQHVSDTGGRTLDWMVVVSPLGLQTESGDAAAARVGPAVRAPRRAVRDPGRDRHTRRRLPLHRVDRGGRDGRAAAVGGGARGPLGELLRRGPHAASRPDLALKPSPHLLVAPRASGAGASCPPGASRRRSWPGALEVNFTPNLGWSNLVQYDSDSRELGFQSRLRWRVRPGSDVFVVFNRGWVHEEDGVFRPYFDRGSAKVQHTFRW